MWARILTHPLPLLPLLGTLAVLASPELQSEASVVTLSVCWVGTMLYRVPAVARMMFTRPTYLEDVERPFAPFESVEERELRLRTHHLFNHTVILTTSLSLGAIVEYGLYRFEDSQLEPLEFVGVVGGLLSLFGDVHVTIGKVLIVVLNYRRHRFARSRRRRVREIEMKAVAARGISSGS